MDFLNDVKDNNLIFIEGFDIFDGGGYFILVIIVDNLLEDLCVV